MEAVKGTQVREALSSILQAAVQTVFPEVPLVK
jgi:hypothetical protein